jgi:superfamily I DNA and/or RNA helicase
MQQLDSHEQIRRVYFSVLETQEHFDEFKQLLALYPAQNDEQGSESAEAANVRSSLNERINSWVDFPFSGLSALQIALLRQMLVEERINVALSPWKESNNY